MCHNISGLAQVMCTAHMVRPLYRQPICAVHVHVHVKKGGTYILSCMHTLGIRDAWHASFRRIADLLICRYGDSVRQRSESIPFQGNTDSAVHVVAFAGKA
jgi:hypothetical protein